VRYIQRTMIKCEKCGFEGTKADFEYVGQEVGTLIYRRCRNCKNIILFDESDEENDTRDVQVWGISPLRGNVFRKKKREGSQESGRG